MPHAVAATENESASDEQDTLNREDEMEIDEDTPYRPLGGERHGGEAEQDKKAVSSVDNAELMKSSSTNAGLESMFEDDDENDILQSVDGAG